MNLLTRNKILFAVLLSEMMLTPLNIIIRVFLFNKVGVCSEANKIYFMTNFPKYFNYFSGSITSFVFLCSSAFIYYRIDKLYILNRRSAEKIGAVYPDENTTNYLAIAVVLFGLAFSLYTIFEYIGQLMRCP